jgi:hypothetical protein
MFTLAFACSHNHCIDLWVAECTIVVEFDLQDSSWFLGNFMFPKFSMNHKNGCKLDCIASEIEGLMFAKCSEDCTDIHWRKRQNLSRDMYWQVEPRNVLAIRWRFSPKVQKETWSISSTILISVQILDCFYWFLFTFTNFTTTNPHFCGPLKCLQSPRRVIRESNSI